MPASIRAEPRAVNRKNFTAAYTRRSPPQIPMMKYIGTSITSQKAKKTSRSRATNTPRIPASRNSIEAKKPFTRVVMAVLASRAMGNRKAVSSTMSREMPSTPRW